MKFVYQEADLREAIFEQAFPDAPEEITKFDLEHIAFGQIIKINGENRLKNCVIVADENGLLIVLMHGFKVDKTIGYQYFKFVNMQGIKVKEGMLFYKLTLQFFSGKNYVIRVHKRDMRNLPNQHENSQKIVENLRSQNLHDMDNEIFKHSKKENCIMILCYVTTLIILLGFALKFGFKYIEVSVLLYLTIIIGTAILHLILFMFAGIYLKFRKSFPFTKEFNAVMNTYRETDDAYQLLENLSNLKNQLKTQEAYNAFNLSMSTALYRTNQLDEAFDYLNAIDTTDKNLLKAVEQQRAVFEGKEVPDPID